MKIVILEYPSNAYGFKDNPVVGFIQNDDPYGHGYIFIPSSTDRHRNMVEVGKIVPWIISDQDYKNIEVL